MACGYGPPSLAVQRKPQAKPIPLKGYPAPPVPGIEGFDRQRVGNLLGVESVSLISDDEHSLGCLAAAMNMNQLAGIHTIVVEHLVTHSFSKCDFSKLLFSRNVMAFNVRAQISVQRH